MSLDPRARWLADRTEMRAATGRVAAFVQQNLDAQREPTRDPYAALGDVLAELERIRTGETVGPDGQDWAASAVHALAGLWADVEQVEEIWLGEEGQR